MRRDYPLLARALLAGASGQLRNKATTGGNLLQRTRCYYFYDTAAPCNKRDPGAGCAAIGGFNRIHAILGASAALHRHASERHGGGAARARRRGRGRGAGRQRDAASRSPTSTAARATRRSGRRCWSPGELITAVRLPPPVGGRQIYRKVRDRSSYAFALVSVAAAVTVADGRIAYAALAFGGLAPLPWRDPASRRR